MASHRDAAQARAGATTVGVSADMGYCVEVPYSLGAALRKLNLPRRTAFLAHHPAPAVFLSLSVADLALISSPDPGLETESHYLVIIRAERKKILWGSNTADATF